MNTSMLVIVISVIIVVFLARAVYFELRARFLRKAEIKWRAYLGNQNPGYDDPDVRWLQERTNKVKRLVEESGNAPGDLGAIQPAGYGYVHSQTYSVLQNWLLKSEGIVPLISTALIQAQGHYKDERNRNLNPLPWIEYLVFLPRHVIGSIDPRIPRWVKDAAQIAYWLAGIYTAIRGLPAITD